MSVRDATTNFDRFVGSGSHYLLPLSFFWFLRWCIVGWTYCNSVLHSLPWSRLQLLQSVLNSAARLIRGLGRFDHITPVLIDLHWLPFPQRISYKICLLMFNCLKGLAPAYLSDLCVGTAAVVGRAGLRSAARGDLVVPGHRTEWGSRSFDVAGPRCWNKLPVGLFFSWSRDLRETLENTLVQSCFFLIRHALLSLYYIL